MLKSIYGNLEEENNLKGLKKKLGKKILDEDTDIDEKTNIDTVKNERQPVEAVKTVQPQGIIQSTYQTAQPMLNKLTKAKTVDTTATAVDPETAKEGGGAAAGAVAGAGGIMDMIGSVTSNTEPMDKKARTANTISMATKGMSTGATIGATVGGPYGMAIGAGAGLLAGVGTSLIQGKGDQKKIDAKKRAEEFERLAKIKLEREEAQKAIDGKATSQKKKAITEGQLSMLANQ